MSAAITADPLADAFGEIATEVTRQGLSILLDRLHFATANPGIGGVRTLPIVIRHLPPGLPLCAQPFTGTGIVATVNRRMVKSGLHVDPDRGHEQKMEMDKPVLTPMHPHDGVRKAR